MEEERLEELLFEIGNDTMEPRKEVVMKTKERIKYSPLIYLIPLSVLLNVVFGVMISTIFLKYFEIKLISITFISLGIISNTIICILLLNEGLFNEKINLGGFSHE